MMNYSKNKLIGATILLFPLLLVILSFLSISFNDYLSGIRDLATNYFTFFTLAYLVLLIIILLIQHIPKLQWILIFSYILFSLINAYRVLLLYSNLDEVTLYPLFFGLFTTAVILLSPFYFKKKIIKNETGN